MRNTQNAALSAFLFLATAAGTATAGYRTEQVPEFEVLVGFGWTHVFEEDVFNADEPSEVGSALALNFACDFNITPSWAVGFHLFGFRKNLEDYILETDNNMIQGVDFDLNATNFGMRARWTLVRGRLSPYLYAGLSYAYGTLSDNFALGHLRYDGIAGALGAGAVVDLTPQVGFGAEVLYAPTGASWDEPPFENSSGTDMDPSMFAVFGQIRVAVGPWRRYR